MSYKIGLLLSMIFVAMFFLFSADLISIQSVYSTLDAKANNISYLISRNGVIDDDFIQYVEHTYDVYFYCDYNLSPTFGEEITYSITTHYHPMIIDKNTMIISITRMTIVGFYG